jgi:hypothetical protein
LLASQLGYQGILIILCQGLLLFALLFGVCRWVIIRRRRVAA